MKFVSGLYILQQQLNGGLWAGYKSSSGTKVWRIIGREETMTEDELLDNFYPVCRLFNQPTREGLALLIDKDYDPKGCAPINQFDLAYLTPAVGHNPRTWSFNDNEMPDRTCGDKQVEGYGLSFWLGIIPTIKES